MSWWPSNSRTTTYSSSSTQQRCTLSSLSFKRKTRWSHLHSVSQFILECFLQLWFLPLATGSRRSNSSISGTRWTMLKLWSTEDTLATPVPSLSEISWLETWSTSKQVIECQQIAWWSKRLMWKLISQCTLMLRLQSRRVCHWSTARRNARSPILISGSLIQRLTWSDTTIITIWKQIHSSWLVPRSCLEVEKQSFAQWVNKPDCLSTRLMRTSSSRNKTPTLSKSWSWSLTMWPNMPCWWPNSLFLQWVCTPSLYCW